jgi:lysine decarboxylase
MPRPETPILNILKDYIKTKIVRFHMPGHKGGRIIHKEIKKLLGTAVFQADVTNVPGMDDLHQPHGAIKEAQEKAASFFGAEATYFLINGSSCGLQALVMTVCGPGEKILVPRNIHRSILGGIIISGAVPVFYNPEYDEDYGIPLGTSVEVIESSLASYPDCKAVLVVSPTYHGIVSDIAAIAAITHRYNIPLLIDEAHGPHLSLNEKLPQGSLQCGADGTVHGTHKILAALTQASMLHIKGTRIDRRRLEAALKVLQSTSTSYLLLSSLDAARAQAEGMGSSLIERSIRLADYVRTRVKEIAGLEVMDGSYVQKAGVFGLDSTKVVIKVRDLGVTGYWLENKLRQRYGVQIEMSDLNTLLLIMSFANTKHDADAFVNGLRTIVREVQESDPTDRAKLPAIPPVPAVVLSPREAFFTAAVSIPLKEAAGRVSAEVIACYPPGIPVICPGEVFSEEIVNYLLAMRDIGVHFQGCFDADLNQVTVIK